MRKVVEILCLRKYKLAEGPLFIFPLAEHSTGVIDAGLPHHIDLAGFFYGLYDLAAVLYRAGHRHGGIDMLACPKCRNHHRAVLVAFGKDRHGVDILSCQHLLKASHGGNVEFFNVFLHLRLFQVTDVYPFNVRVCFKKRNKMTGKLPTTDYGNS